MVPATASALAVAVAAIGTLAFAGVVVRSRRGLPGTPGLGSMLGSAGGWSLIVAVHTWPRQLLALHYTMALRQVLALGIAVGWFWFAVEYARARAVARTPRRVGAVLAVPVLTGVVTATNPLHHLAYGPGTPALVGNGAAVAWGPWYAVVVVYAAVLVVAGMALLGRALRGAHGRRRTHLGLLAACAGLLFLAANDGLIVRAIGGPPTLSFAPFAFFFASVGFSISRFRDLFGMVPVSRRTVVEAIPDPVVVTDRNDVVVDINASATELFGLSAPVGDSLDAVCREYPDFLDAYRRGSGKSAVTIEVDGQHRHFSVIRTPVTEGAGESVVVLREVTELRRRTTHLDLFRAVMVHDIPGHLALAATHLDRIDATDQRPVETVREMLDDIDRIVSKGQTLARLDVEDLAFDPTSVRDSAVHAWTVAETEAVEASLDIETDAVVAADSEFLLSLFENLFENSIEHGAASGEPLEITVGSLPDGFYVADTGTGVPRGVRAGMFEPGTTTSESGTGMGLSIVATVADLHGWSVEYVESAAGGARFEFTGVEFVEERVAGEGRDWSEGRPAASAALRDR